MKELVGDVGELQPQQYFPGNTFVGALPSELGAFDQRAQYNQGMYGPGGFFGDVMGAAQNQLGGGAAGRMSGVLSPFATAGLINSFGQGPGQVGSHLAGFGGPQFGQAGSLDATGALGSMLSGTPDYAGVQGAIEAANAPILRQLNEDIIPGLNSRATLLGNSSGGIKTLNRVLPEIGERMSQNALGITEGERQRALGAQQWAAGQIAQGGLQANQLGLNRSMFNAGQRSQADLTNANLGAQFRGDLLGLGGLAGNLSGMDATNQARIMSMFPALAQAGAQPSQDAMTRAAFDRMMAEGQLGADINRFNFGQQEPYNRLQFQSGIYSQLAPGAQQQPQGNNFLGALGGAITGMNLGGSIADMFRGPSVYPGGGVPMVNQPQFMNPYISGAALQFPQMFPVTS